jgi:hypothetical protein
MPPKKYLLPLTLSACWVIAATAQAQIPAAASAPTATAASSAAAATSAPAVASATVGTAPAQGTRAPRPAAALPPPPPLVPWTRPADGPPIFTEDFESGTLDDKIWSKHVTGKTTITVQQDMVAHGKYALKVNYPAGTTRSYAFISVPVPEALREHFYGRVYIYISGVPDPHSVLMFSGSTGFPTANWLEIGAYTGHFQPSLQINAPTPDIPKGEVPPFQGTLPVGRWFCLEWEFIDKPDRIVLWVDGKLDVNMPFTYSKIVNPNIPKDSGLIGGFFEFDLGYRTFASGALIPKDINIYYDDIAIGDKPIGQLTPVAAQPAPADTKPATSSAATTAASAAAK